MNKVTKVKIKPEHSPGKVPDFIYNVIAQDDKTVKIGWQTRDWNERTLLWDEVIVVE